MGLTVHRCSNDVLIRASFTARTVLGTHFCQIILFLYVSTRPVNYIEPLFVVCQIPANNTNNKVYITYYSMTAYVQLAAIKASIPLQNNGHESPTCLCLLLNY